MLSMSLRFVPTLMDDTTRIMNAQKARGVDFGEGSIIQKVKAMIPILILFCDKLKRADSSAIIWKRVVTRVEKARIFGQLKWTGYADHSRYSQRLVCCLFS